MPAIVGALLSVLVLTGCASTEVTSRHQLVKETLPRPGQILVYDFAATPAEVPADSSLTGQASAPAAPPTAEQAALPGSGV